MKAPDLAVIVLAAGAGRRLGGPKALALWHGRPFLTHVLDRLERALPGQPVVVVFGAGGPELRDIARARDARPVENPSWDDGGMLSSIHVGLDAVGDVEGLLLWPVDHPGVDPSTLQALAGAGARDCVVVPTHGRRRGHPVLFGGDYLVALRDAPPDEGARAVVRAPGTRVVELPVDDPFIHLDVDTPEDARHLDETPPS